MAIATKVTPVIFKISNFESNNNPMKKYLLFISLIIVPLFVTAQTNVSGNQSGTWTAANAPYQVTGHITVPTGQILTIEAGVEVNFQGHYKFNVNGKLIVNGEEENMVLFTTDDTATGWGGIRFDTVSEISVFNYCTIEYGKATGDYPDMHGGAVLLKESDAEFYHCIFQNNQAIGSGDDGMGGAVYAYNTGTETETLTKFIDCTFENNQSVTEGGAIKFTNDGNTEITRCKFLSNSANYGGGAIMFYSAVDVHLTNCLFYSNYSNNSGGGAIKTLNPTVSLFFTNCTITSNSAYGAGEGGAVALDYADATFVNCIIYDNYQQYGSEINIGMSATATINYCDVDMPDDATGSNNLDNLNPLFITTGSESFHLQEGSPCINAGVDVGLPYQGTAPEMGCYEYDETVGIEDYRADAITMYPNPANDSVSFDEIENLEEITIIDSTGKKIADYSVDYLSHRINLSRLTTGVYYIQFKTERGTLSKKIIRE
jgi:predicted outer membrane repeat protein